jgi:hypothetical protein
MKYLAGFGLNCLLLLAGCSGKNPVSPIEATNQEAIYNVLFQDNYRIVAFDFLDLAMPDTQAFIDNPDPNKPCIWHDVQFTDEDLIVTILDQPVPSPVGLVYEGHVTYTVNDTGKIRILMYNAAADSIERDSVKFDIRANRSATCQQWGQVNKVRRGWLLTSISDARITAGQSYHFLSNFTYSSASHRDTTFVYGNHEPGELVSFSQSEQVTFQYQLPDSLDRVFAYIPDNDYGYGLAEPVRDSLGIWRASFTMPSRKINGQLFFFVVNVGQFDQVYRASGFSYNYRIR